MQKFYHPDYRPVRQKAEDMAKISLWINTVKLARADQAVQRRALVAAMIRAEEEIVSPAQSDSSQGSFRRIVVHFRQTGQARPPPS